MPSVDAALAAGLDGGMEFGTGVSGTGVAPGSALES